MAYPPDPGGVFASDVHRRVLGHLSSEATAQETVFARLAPDAHTAVGEDDLGEVLMDLEADGHASQTKAGWKATKKGSNALAAPIPDEED